MGDVNVPMIIIADDNDANDIGEAAPTKIKKYSSKGANSYGSKASKPPRSNVNSTSASEKKRKSIYWEAR